MTKSETIYSIQILRGIAALFIVIGHGQEAARELASLAGRSFAIWQPVPWGSGVDIFFVISGFIIFYASERYEGTSWPSRSFFAHRIARLVPLYWTCTCLFLALVMFKKLLGFAQGEEFPSGLAIFTSLLFVPFNSHALPDGLAFPVYNLGWTLNYEMYFYMLFALCLGRSRRQSALRILVILCSIAIFGYFVSPSLLPFSFWSQPIILEFGMGIAIAIAYRQGVVLRLPVRLALIGVGILLMVFLPFGRPSEFEGTVLNDFGHFVIFGIPAVFLVTGAALGPDIESNIFLSAPIAIGNGSYSLYLVHPFVIFAFSTLFRRMGFLNGFPMLFFIGLVIVVASVVAVVSYHLFERPSARVVSNWLIPKTLDDRGLKSINLQWTEPRDSHQ